MIEKHQIALVKRELPNVVIEWMGKKWQARVSGRLNQFASVSPYCELYQRGLIKTIIGPIFHYSWEAVARSYYHNAILKT